VEEYIQQNKAMRQLAKEYTWLSVWLVEILTNRMYGGSSRSVMTQLESLEENEAKKIGASLSPILGISANESNAVCKWVKRYPAMLTFSEKYSFIIPMLITIITRARREVTWKMRLEAFMNGAFAYICVAMDIYIISFYLARSEQKWLCVNAYFLLGAILLHVSTLCCNAYWFYGHDKRAFRNELLYALTFQKSARIQFQTLRGENTPGCRIDFLLEFGYTKISELFTLGIGAGIIQTFALVFMEGERSQMQFLSVMLSTLLAAYDSSTLSVYSDLDPNNRAKSGEYYGYIPGKSIDR
jgi:hypothetical protein